MDSNQTEALGQRNYTFIFQKMKNFWIEMEKSVTTHRFKEDSISIEKS